MEEVGNAPDVDAAEHLRCPRGGRGPVIAGDALQAMMRTTARALRGRGPGDARAAVSVRDAVSCIADRRAARGVSRCGTCVPYVQSFSLVFGAGVEPATYRLKICCSTV